MRHELATLSSPHPSMTPASVPRGEGHVDLSVVVPCYDEAGSLRELHRRLVSVLTGHGSEYELLFVDDGSTDGSREILKELCAANERTGVITFRRNFGKAAALHAGFRQARGDVIVTLDGDLQDLPSEIPTLVQRLDEGFDLVSGWKQDRKDPIGKTLPSAVFNATVRLVSGLELHDFNCGLKAYRREAARSLRLYGEMHRFIPVLLHWQGYSVSEVPVEHQPRRSGRSKYGVARLWKGFFDLATVTLNTRFRARPLHLFGWVGAAIGGLGLLILLYLVGLWLAGVRPIGDRPLLLFGALMVMVGIQLVSTGLLGEMITRGQQMEKPAYVIQSIRRPGHADLQPGEVSDPEPPDAPDHRQVHRPDLR
jgi:glycosyltransferase involved in cell wall biosynthesis